MIQKMILNLNILQFEERVGKSIDQIVDFRFKLVRGKYRIDATNFKEGGRIVDKVQELALTERPVEVEALFSKKPRGMVKLDDEVQPFGPSARMEKLTAGNGRFERSQLLMLTSKKLWVVCTWLVCMTVCL